MIWGLLGQGIGDLDLGLTIRTCPNQCLTLCSCCCWPTLVVTGGGAGCVSEDNSDFTDVSQSPGQRPIRGQYSGHVTCRDQSEVSIPGQPRCSAGSRRAVQCCSQDTAADTMQDITITTGCQADKPDCHHGKLRGTQVQTFILGAQICSLGGAFGLLCL